MRIGKLLDSFLRRNRRQKITLLVAAFLVYITALTGVFSYYHSEDAVTNRFVGRYGSVTIREPAWDSTGQAMAAASEPGMEIPKDPGASMTDRRMCTSG